MKTVIVISGEPSNRFLYQSALKRRYSVEISETALEQQPAAVDAIAYDISGISWRRPVSRTTTFRDVTYRPCRLWATCSKRQRERTTAIER